MRHARSEAKSPYTITLTRPLHKAPLYQFDRISIYWSKYLATSGEFLFHFRGRDVRHGGCYSKYRLETGGQCIQAHTNPLRRISPLVPLFSPSISPKGHTSLQAAEPRYLHRTRTKKECFPSRSERIDVMAVSALFILAQQAPLTPVLDLRFTSNSRCRTQRALLARMWTSAERTVSLPSPQPNGI